MIKSFLSFCLMALLTSGHAAEKSDLVCQSDSGRSWRPFNTKTKNWIGTAGATDQELCVSKYLSTFSNNVVCVYEGKETYRPYNAETGSAIGTGSAQGIGRCKEYALTARSGLVCVYRTTDKYNVYRISDGQILGENLHSAGSLQRCKEYIDTYRDGLICHYSGTVGDQSTFKAYRIKDNLSYGFPYGTSADTLSACGKQLARFALTPDGEERDIKDEVERVKELMEEDLAPLVKKLSRTVYFYSYYQKTELNLTGPGSVDLRSPEALSALETWRSAFDAHVPFESGWLGFGLYGAVNPVDSQGYASGDWTLTEIETAPHSLFLDLRIDGASHKKNNHFHFSNKTKKKLQAICGINETDFYETTFKVNGHSFDWSIDKGELSKNRICHVALIEALKSLDLDFLIYDWNWVTRTHQGGCDTNEKPAAVFLKDVARFPGVKVFDLSGNDQYMDDYRRIYQLSRQRSTSPVASWPSYKDANATKVDLTEELRYQFGCKAEFTEDRPWF